MSNKVVTAPASEAKRPVRSHKPAQQAAEQAAVNEDEARLANDDSEQEVSVASVNEEGEAPVESETSSAPSETSMAGDFTFGSALAEAAAASGSLITDAEEADEVGFGAFGDGDGSTPLLIGAVALAALGLVFILKDGGNGDDDVVPVNTAPTITPPAAATTAEDTAVTVAAPTTTDADGDTVTVTATATNGTVVKNADGTFTFTPAADYNGSATITFSANDGTATTTATTTVTVTPVNDAPVFAAESAAITVDEDDTFSDSIASAASDVEGDDLTFSLQTQATNGVAVVNADGTYTYTPNADFNGTDSYVVAVSDGNGGTDTITVNVTVNPVNDPAVLSPLTVDANENTALNLSDLLSITDVDGDAAAVVAAVTTDPQQGTITIVNGDVIYTPNADYFGPDTVGFTLTDDQGLAESYVVAINVAEDTGPTPISIDIGTASVAQTVDAGNGEFNLTDNAEATSNVNIVNFSSNDVITVTNAVASDYNFARSFEDINDLVITYTDPGTGATNTYVIQDILPDTGSVAGLAAATNTVGFDFMTFA